MAALVETVGTGVINGSAFTRANPSELIAVWTGGSESTTPLMLKPNSINQVHVEWTSGTVAIQLAVPGQTNWSAYLVSGSATLAADQVVEVYVSRPTLLRVTGATAVATVTIRKG